MKSYHVTILFTSIFCHAPKVAAQKYTPDHGTAINSKTKFSDILGSIANLNEQRLNALKRYTALDQRNVAKGILRIADDKERDPMVAVMLMNKKNSEDNKVFEIFEADDVNSYGSTPVRNIIQRIKEYFNTAKDTAKDSLPSSSTSSSESDDLKDILSDCNYKNNIERDRKESSDGEEINANKSESTIKHNDENESDGEEIIKTNNKEAIAKEPDGKDSADKETTAKETMKSKTEVDPKNRNSSGGEELIVHGKEIVKLSDIKSDKKNILRLFEKCNKEAVRRCKKACKKANKEVCDVYKCSRGMKKASKRNCKRQCKDKFTD